MPSTAKKASAADTVAPMCFCNSSLQSATVTGFVLAPSTSKSSPCVGSAFCGVYDFVVEVCWSGGERRYLRRSYADFLRFQANLVKSFRGRLDNGQRFVSLPCRTAEASTPNARRFGFWRRNDKAAEKSADLFADDLTNTPEMAEQQELLLNRWLCHLLDLPTEICDSVVVESFFEARDTDPVPASHRPDRYYGTVSSPRLPPSLITSTESSSASSGVGTSSSSASNTSTTASPASSISPNSEARLRSPSIAEEGDASTRRSTSSSEGVDSEQEELEFGDDGDGYFFDDEIDDLVSTTRPYFQPVMQQTANLLLTAAPIAESHEGRTASITSTASAPEITMLPLSNDFDSTIAEYELSQLMQKVNLQNVSQRVRQNLTQVWLSD